jgi:hypothetical protein
VGLGKRGGAGKIKEDRPVHRQDNININSINQLNTSAAGRTPCNLTTRPGGSLPSVSESLIP